MRDYDDVLFCINEDVMRLVLFFVDLEVRLRRGRGISSGLYSFIFFLFFL